MTYNFESRHDRLRSRMREVNSRTLTYTRGGNSDSISATVYEMKPEDIAPWGMSLDIRHFSIIVHVSAIEAILGDGGRPKKHDIITDANTGVRLQVEPFADQPPYQYTNHQRKAMRIHAIEVGELQTDGSSSSGSGS